jgi:hypothetical protein
LFEVLNAELFLVLSLNPAPVSNPTRKMYFRTVLLIALAAMLCEFDSLAAVTTPAAPPPSGQYKITIPANIAPLLDRYCMKCHKDADADGDVRFDVLASMETGPVLSLLNKAESQLFFKLMPPEDAKQPSPQERQALFAWVYGELKKNNASGMDQKARFPDAGNWVDHVSLFNGSVKAQPYSPARRWLVSPQIFMQRVVDIFDYSEKERKKGTPNFVGLNNPFVLTDHSGVRDYDTTALNGAHLLTMLDNAEWISKKQIRSALVKKGEIQAKVFERKYDTFSPPTPPAFEVIVLKTTPPTEAEMQTAIKTQFERVLKRQPTDAEMNRYMELMSSAVQIAGNSEGLRQMLAGVLLESEFVYRMEFGEGMPDEAGRKKLAPREAAFAIAYSIGDRNPDAALSKAAAEGRLATKADYEREVRRLLADLEYNRGVVDPSIAGKGVRPPTTPHPKIVRFFREFFGYPMALKNFKDVNRSNGYFDNAGRGTAGTAGILVNEADMFVDYFAQQDKAVFENLLGSDLFFVAPIEDAEKKVVALNEVYAEFKDKNWRTDAKNKKKPEPWLNPEQTAFIRKRLNYNSSERDLDTAMTHIEHFKKKGLDPNPSWSYPFGIHKLMPHTNSYNLAPPDWDYAEKQPFKLQNRMGVLTHPAWLLAHAQNTATDPIRRGRWVREKLLAGSVPDVPITVDAKIPDDPHKTLGERLHMVTNKEECWKCHQRMNPLGIPFEMYDDFGRFRTAESLEYPENLIAKTKAKYGADTYKTVAFSTKGTITGTGEPGVDGEVKDAIDLINRLSKSQRVRQSIIRHAFRFYMGRNELLSDSQTLIDADRAYVKSGGSFKEVIVSLLTSDSFMYRK